MWRVLQLFLLLPERHQACRVGPRHDQDRSFEYTWHIASLRLPSKQQSGHWHNLIFLIKKCDTHCACWRLYGDLHASNASGCGRMKDKNSVYNMSFGSKSRAGIEHFFWLLWIMYHCCMSLLQTVCVFSS